MAELIGLREFERALKNLEQQTRGQVLRQATLKSVQPLVRVASILAPRDSGGLSRSMTAQSMSYAVTTEAIVRVGPGRPAGSHGVLLELGTIHMTSKPFLGVAYAATRDVILNEMRLNLGTILTAMAVAE